MTDDIFLGNVLPTALNAFDTGDADANDAIGTLQRAAPAARTPQYVALTERAAKAGPDRLLPLLDEAAVGTGHSQWSDDHLKSLRSKDRKRFKAHYDEVGVAVSNRCAYLAWLIGAVCHTPAGLARAIEITRAGTTEARRVASHTLLLALTDDDSKRRVAEGLDLREWDGKERMVEVVYRVGVILLSQIDPDALFERYAPLLGPSLAEGDLRFIALFSGLRDARSADGRWAQVGFAHMNGGDYERTVVVFGLLEHLTPDPSWVEPLCQALPKPSKRSNYWPPAAVDALARAADARAIPWLVGALYGSTMAWPACRAGFRRVGDPAMAHVVRDWLSTQPPSGRHAEAEELIAELERDGAVAPPDLAYLDDEPEPPRTRTTLEYADAPAFEAPALDSLEETRASYLAAFERADLAEYFERIAKPAVWLIPARVDERTLQPGGTKLGGHPDLPKGTKWPRVKGEPLTFLAQFDLAEVAPHLPAGGLPGAGLLSVFMGADAQSRLGYCTSAKALYTAPGAALSLQEAPKDFYAPIFQAATVRFHPTLRLPSPNNKQLTKLLKGAKLERYEDDVFDETAPLLPQLLGYRDHGYDAEEPATSELLLQLPGDTQTEMEFGDGEVLGLYLASAKLAAGDFGKIWPRLGD